VEDLLRLGGGLGGGLLGSRLAGSIDRGAASRDYVDNAPSTEELSAAARAKYEEGHSLGLKIKPVATARLDAEMRRIAADSGLITPTGRVIDNADVKQAFALLEDFQKGNVDTKQLQSLRSIINDIAGSSEPKLSRVGVQMKRTFDDFLGRFAPQFREANALNTRAMRGEMMDRAEELADIRASQFTQSGSENALRTEFRQLDRDIARGSTRGLRPDQIAAVQDVSRGTAATNAARQVGKMAPRGVVSAGLTGGVPFMVGTAIGGPGLGATLAGGTMATGILGQSLATLLQRNAAARASAAMRQAVPLNLPPRMSGILGMIPALAGQATTQGPQ
jgi:hypothetical protein